MVPGHAPLLDELQRDALRRLLAHRGLELGDVSGVGAELAGRYGGADLSAELEAAMRRQAAKRVALQFVEERRVTWDHRKLGGTY